MKQDTKLTPSAKPDFTIRHFVFAIIIFVISVVGIIFAVINKKLEFIYIFIALILVAIVLLVSCGIVLYRKNKKKEPTKIEK